MLDKVFGLLKKRGKTKDEERDLISEVEEAIESESEASEEAEALTEKLGVEDKVLEKKGKGEGGLLKKMRKMENKKLLLVGAGGGLAVLALATLLIGGEEEEHYSESLPLDNIQTTSLQTPPPSGSQGAPSSEAGSWNAPAPQPPPPQIAQEQPSPGAMSPPPSIAGAGDGAPQALSPTSIGPPAPPAGMQSPPPPAPVGSSPVVQQIQKRVVDNPFVIKQVDRLVREAIQRVLEEERNRIKKEMEALKGEPSSSLPSNKGPISIGLEDEEEKEVEASKEVEEPVPQFTNAVVASSVVEKNGEVILITNIGLVKKGLTVGDGWKVVEVGKGFIVLEKEYYKLEGTKKVKKKKTEVVPYIFDFSAKS